MDIKQTQQNNVTILSIQGTIVSGDLGELRSLFEDCVNNGQVRIMLELSKVPFIDSEGLETILDFVFSISKRDGEVCLGGVNQVCRDIFLATRMERYVRVMEDSDSAIRSLG